jgi:hypothetical protein
MKKEPRTHLVEKKKEQRNERFLVLSQRNGKLSEANAELGRAHIEKSFSETARVRYGADKKISPFLSLGPPSSRADS